nr:hypothetical protein [uncultured Romboutsia sp.]
MKIDLDLTDILTLKFLVIEKLDTYKTEKIKITNDKFTIDVQKEFIDRKIKEFSNLLNNLDSAYKKSIATEVEELNNLRNQLKELNNCKKE